MINGLGVVGWGVGGIEAEAVMLGQPIYMLTPGGCRVQVGWAVARGYDGDGFDVDGGSDVAREGRGWISLSSFTARG